MFTLCPPLDTCSTRTVLVCHVPPSTSPHLSSWLDSTMACSHSMRCQSSISYTLSGQHHNYRTYIRFQMWMTLYKHWLIAFLTIANCMQSMGNCMRMLTLWVSFLDLKTKVYLCWGWLSWSCHNFPEIQGFIYHWIPLLKSASIYML